MNAHRVCVLVLAAAMSAPVIAGPDWHAQVAAHEGGDVETSCGAIWGRLGVIQAWTHTKVSDSRLFSDDGRFGAEWSGFRYPMCAPASTSFEENARVIHQWRQTGNEGGSYTPVIHCKVTAQNKSSGFANILEPEDPSWWWAPQVTLTDYAPVIWYADSNDASELGWDAIDTNNRATVSGTGGSNAPGAGDILTAGHGTDPAGAFEGTIDMSDIYGTDALLEIEYAMWGVCNRTSDNAIVSEWKVYIESDVDSWKTAE